MRRDLYFKLFSSSVMVRGKSFGAIYLLNRERIERIPLEICDLIGGLSQFSIEQVKNQFENSLLVEQWIDYLWKNNIGHFTSEPTLFCDLPTEYHRPSFIHRAQIEISPKSSFDVASIAFQLDNLLCKHIEIRCVGLVRIETISSLISCFSRSCVRSIDLYVEKSSDIKKEDIVSVVENNPKIHTVYLFNSLSTARLRNVFFITRDFPSISEKKWDLNRLVVNNQFFSESIKHNTFYHKKIAIDSNGFVKNDLSLSETFGNVNTTNISNIVFSDDFMRFWDINVDLIEQLKDSELRYAIYPARPLIQENGKYHIKI